MLIPRPVFGVVSIGDIASRCNARLRILGSYRSNWKILGLGIHIVFRNPVKCTCTSLCKSRLPYILAQVSVGGVRNVCVFVRLSLRNSTSKEFTYRSYIP